MTSPTQQFALADIVSVDQLGYSCIREDQIDVAFHATGKGVRLPRTCLPEPCRAALDRMQLASLIGRPPKPIEWDDYFSRYADHCRKEVVPFDGAGAPDTISDRADFWAPLIASYPPNAPIRNALPPGSAPGGQLTSTTPGSGGFVVAIIEQERRPSGPGSSIDVPDGGGTDPGDTPHPITPVPLPGGLILALTSLAFLLRGVFRRN